jgi:hypothetical protein
MPQHYKINASEVEVIDRPDVFVTKDVESVLQEIYAKLGTGGGAGNTFIYTSFSSEYPSADYSFFQDPFMEVIRDDPTNSYVEYDNVTPTIKTHAGISGSVPKYITFSTQSTAMYSVARAAFKLNFSGNIVHLILNKTGNSYYDFRLTPGTTPKLYVVVSGSPTLLASGSTTLGINTLYDCVSLKSGNRIQLVINSGLPDINVLNAALNRAGKPQIKSEIPTLGNHISYYGIELGQVVRSPTS